MSRACRPFFLFSCLPRFRPTSATWPTQQTAPSFHFAHPARRVEEPSDDPKPLLRPATSRHSFSLSRALLRQYRYS
ncbi:unnamed protein product [Protopolystoma xenopodis]|uniref:Uncharacterized protein n=1 Tax=Protopolystoma xenopodis TaxID=117903 RepID=A0A3S5FG25_9PLAT|nr:unnamed protein product [Protopolystoma xenopodis]